MQEVKYSLLLGADNFIEEIKEKFIKKKELKEYEPQLRKIKDVKSIGEIGALIAKEYAIKAQDILRLKSEYKEARKLLVALSYQIHVRRSSLRKIGEELGGLSGPGVVRVHERLMEALKSNGALNNRYHTLKSNLSIV